MREECRTACKFLSKFRLINEFPEFNVSPDFAANADHKEFCSRKFFQKRDNALELHIRTVNKEIAFVCWFLSSDVLFDERIEEKNPFFGCLRLHEMHYDVIICPRKAFQHSFLGQDKINFFIYCKGWLCIFHYVHVRNCYCRN